MSLSPRAIALQGIGYGVVVVALQGFMGAEVALPDQPSFGGSSSMLAPMKRRQIDEEEELMAIIQMALHVMGRRP